MVSRWYYNRYTQSCQEFTYGGCLGNANNFLTSDDCEKRCWTIKSESDGCPPRPRAAEPGSDGCPRAVEPGSDGAIRAAVPSSDGYPRAAADGGPCRSYFKRYAFNLSSMRCEEFVYGGCYGNDNNFKDLQSCFCLFVCLLSFFFSFLFFPSKWALLMSKAKDSVLQRTYILNCFMWSSYIHAEITLTAVSDHSAVSV
uniref:Tissue factor pathway inhibitor 2 n=1 Tax=Nothoprocta perdicaria TaxID=30464 RepID=A0A8C6YIU7_NOTPE